MHVEIFNIRCCWDIHLAASLHLAPVAAAVVVLVVPILAFPPAGLLLWLAAVCIVIVHGSDYCSAVADTLLLHLPLSPPVNSLRGRLACLPWFGNLNCYAWSRCFGCGEAVVVVEGVGYAEIERAGVVVVGDAAKASIVGGGMKAEIAVVVVEGGPTSG